MLFQKESHIPPEAQGQARATHTLPPPAAHTGARGGPGTAVPRCVCRVRWDSRARAQGPRGSSTTEAHGPGPGLDLSGSQGPVGRAGASWRTHSPRGSPARVNVAAVVSNEGGGPVLRPPRGNICLWFQHLLGQSWAGPPAAGRHWNAGPRQVAGHRRGPSAQGTGQKTRGVPHRPPGPCRFTSPPTSPPGARGRLALTRCQPTTTNARSGPICCLSPQCEGRGTPPQSPLLAAREHRPAQGAGSPQGQTPSPHPGARPPETNTDPRPHCLDLQAPTALKPRELDGAGLT